MANNITRMPRGAVPQQQGVPSQQWWGGMPGWGGSPGWNGGDCCPDDSAPPFPCPPPGWPPPGCPPWFSGQNSPPWYPGANAGVSFGTTPPPNPVRGHFWWDGVTLWMFDGAAWVAAGGGSAGQGAASVAIGTTPPVAPQPGALWFDGGMLLLWTGTAWVPTEGNATGASPPANPTDGMLWWNGSTLQVWDGNAWVPVSQTKSYIQATAPPSPNPGDTWWNGTQMRIWDGTAWNLIGPGATVGPVPTTSLVFSISVASAGVPSADYPMNITQFSSPPTLDSLTGWNGTTKQYTPTKAGFYLCECSQLITPGEGGHAVIKNDSGSWNISANNVIQISAIAGGTNNWQSTTGVVNLNGTTDFVRHWNYMSTGTFQTPNANVPALRIYLLP
jgi:hypothetical protein